MTFDWLRLALLLVDLLRWIDREKLRAEARGKLKDKLREAIDADIKRAEEARARLRAELDAAPGKLRDDGDAFQRD